MTVIITVMSFKVWFTLYKVQCWPSFRVRKPGQHWQATSKWYPEIEWPVREERAKSPALCLEYIN